MCVQARTCRDQRRTSSSLPLLLTAFLQDLSLNQKLAASARLASQQAFAVCLFPVPTLGCRECSHAHFFCIDPGDLDLGPHACTARTLNHCLKPLVVYHTHTLSDMNFPHSLRTYVKCMLFPDIPHLFPALQQCV